MSDHRRRLLPPIGALASFAAAARHDSFSRAGEEIGLTQSAVSRQVALLEEWLQLSLFQRNGRRVRLNRAGATYLKSIEPALNQIRVATGAAISQKSDRELNIATLPSFGMRWLAPRLPRLNALFPDLIVNFSARSYPFAFEEEIFDAAIHFGEEDWPNAVHHLLFREVSIPVCAPTRLASQPINLPEDVLNWPLLVLGTRRGAWMDWLSAAGVDRAPPPPSGSFEHFLMLAQAAEAGAGIALIPRFLIEDELASGALVSPSPIALENENAYYLVFPSSEASRSSLNDFRAWLLEEARALPD
ncbi:DNA-binding transcriptional LysR family regulator [Novosphingobium sp. SG751A]|uniref:LysR substrate-binding domain-containing protein n=1 Tax=Novosphingobium sp. SG751A TaxID=2587000 RepID=UPI00155370B7|nr:LysR substrate-binding domain-containing protein [Novosphingobium sp. SG751A]NOW44950.1 DNA-binding transcriptional LysR family regulator [Novosphingobium sp. SG751A]